MPRNGIHPESAIVTYDGRDYEVADGLVVLNWQKQPVRFHQRGCRLCCMSGGAHMGEGACTNCGPRFLGKHPDLCRLCDRTAHFRDEDGPVHKACLERAVLTAARKGSVG